MHEITQSIYLQHSPENAPLYEFLESCLRHKSELVIYEAARAMVNLKSVQSKDLQPAVSGKYGTMVKQNQGGNNVFLYRRQFIGFCELVI